MSWAKRIKSVSSLFYSVTVLAIVATAMWFGANFNTSEASEKTSDSNVGAPVSFPGTGVGAIPDRATAGCGGGVFGANRDVTFNVTGLSGSVSDVNVDLTATHSWVGDVRVQLIAPNATTHVVFERTGATTATSCGDTSNLGALYNFDDSATLNWWQTVGTTGDVAIPTGNYRTTAAGPQGTATDAPVTSLNAAFAGVANPNGTWTLRFSDTGGGDTGSVSAANLTIDTATVIPAGSTWLDFDGDGKTDYTQARSVPADAPANGEIGNVAMRGGSYRERLELQKQDTEPNELGVNAINWYAYNSGSGSASIAQHGIATTDFITPNDYDGDDKADFAVWRTAAAGSAAFYILESTTSTVRTELFGQTNDDSGVTGDYDGDGKADVAVFRCPPATGPCTFFYRGSAGMGETTYVPWGNGTLSTLFASPGDFDGDGKHDFCLQRTNPDAAGKGQFVLLRSSDGGVEFINWGNNTDVIAPGDYDGDGKDDHAVVRNIGGQLTWYVLLRTGGTGQANWGITNDFVTPGDYDGDGKTDLSVWRPNANPDANFFYVYRSSNNTVSTFEWGQNGDYPPANSQVH